MIDQEGRGRREFPGGEVGMFAVLGDELAMPILTGALGHFAFFVEQIENT